MPVESGKITDETRARLEADARDIIARYPVARSALLPMLHLVQGEEGFVSPDGIAFCARMLDLTTAEVAAVATFYTMYKRHPNGTYTVGVCTNTLCAVMGGDEIFRTLSEHLGIGHDETTADGAVTLERIECNAACDYAPVVMVNWEFFDNQTPGSARELTDRLQAGETVAPTRGASSVCTFKQMSRVLAGFSDGRADEGVGAGPATLRGTLLAKERGWTAPAGRERRATPAGQAGPAGQDGPAGQAGPAAQDGPAGQAGQDGPAGQDGQAGQDRPAGQDGQTGPERPSGQERPSGRGRPAGQGRRGGRGGRAAGRTTEEVGAEAAARSGSTSASDVGPVPPGSDRGGTTAGKPPADATEGTEDSGRATTPRPRTREGAAPKDDATDDGPGDGATDDGPEDGAEG
jgi:NADH-quinone oxidoreductase subunit E